MVHPCLSKKEILDFYDEEMKMYGGEVDLEAARKRRLATMCAKSAELGRNA
jgi:hypothetical protein